MSKPQSIANKSHTIPRSGETALPRLGDFTGTEAALLYWLTYLHMNETNWPEEDTVDWAVAEAKQVLDAFVSDRMAQNAASKVEL